MAVLTNKPVRFSTLLLQRLQLDQHFFRVYGGNSFQEKKPHPMGIERLVEESGADRARTVMVGDSAVDVLTARNAGVSACGVSWGFQPETFADAPPDFVIDDLGELAEMVLTDGRSSPR
jgi:phosphoglycolate phosphatase